MVERQGNHQYTRLKEIWKSYIMVTIFVYQDLSHPTLIEIIEHQEIKGVSNSI